MCSINKPTTVGPHVPKQGSFLVLMSQPAISKDLFAHSALGSPREKNMYRFLLGKGVVGTLVLGFISQCVWSSY